MKKQINVFLNGYQYLIEHYSFPDRSIMWFRKCVYAILALKMLFLLSDFDTFYTFIPLRGFVPRSLKILYISPLNNFHTFIWFVLSFIVCLGVVLKRRLWLSILIFAIGIMYLRLISITGNNSDSIISYFIFMLIFIREGAERGTIRQMINNICLFTLQLSFCLIYFINGLGKMVLPFWRSGTFMHDVWFYPFYARTPLIPEWFTAHWVTIVMGWSVMIFEIAFAFLIWFRPFKKWLFAIGILFHLGIAVLLSLPEFGLTMIIGYFMFTQVDIIKEIRQFREREIPNK